ncbi:MAG TPA: orotate phosphoribosyltransferase [Myxococcota bacterium]|nr:orotate phosphoribosyltransferase [Myxococcota bacterium]
MASGLITDFYIDARPVYLRGEGQFLIGELFYEELVRLEQNGERFDACGGMATGAIPLACALSNAAFRRGRELPCLFVRKNAKDHGLEASVEGMKALKRNSHVLMLEDVVTTAGSSIKAYDAFSLEGLVVKHLLALVDREQGGRGALSERGISMHALFTLNELREMSDVDCHERTLSERAREV